ncbi:aldo/keto reductase [Meridianimarinicoccus sp. RP-17]|uniref:aldo/keto reductase n=1 Tax=Meridianimarinicoccus zhengii TaxID=2056810 RepID=UPI000DAED977|nr:aldo/keto reductase [Phycocomes zhengii]
MQRAILAPDFSLSRIVYGMWRLGDDDDTGPAHVQAKIEACLDQGITTFDQADIYGGYTAEAIFGGALRAAPHLRERMEIVTKCGIVAPAGRHEDARVKHYDTSAAHITASVDQSLADMAIERIDLLLIHRPDPLMNHAETGGALDALVASGKVRHVGVSNFKPHDWTLLQSAMRTPLVTNQIEISLLHTDPFTNGDIAFLQERGVVPMAWSPLGGGALFKKKNKRLAKILDDIGERFDVDAAAVAVAWLMHHPAWIAPVMGTNSLSRIATLGDACKVQLDREDWFALYTEANGEEVP